MSHVFFAANNGDIGGGEVMLLAMARAARESGREVSVVGPAGSKVLKEAWANNFAVVSVKGEGRRGYMRNLRNWDRRERQGLLWANGLVPALATAGRKHRVVHLHQVPQRLQSAAATLARQGAARTIVPSGVMADAMPGTQVMWNWVERVETQKRSFTSSVVTLGFLGRISTGKGVGVLADAVKLLSQKQPNRFKLLLAGEARFVGAEDQKLIDAQLSALGPAVVRPGWMSRDEFFDQIDLAVFPSVWPESFGLVVAEAMSARVPFVISDAGAFAEVAGPDHPWVAKKGDAASLASTIAAAAASYTTQELDAGQDRWASEFSPEAGRERLVALLESIGW